tara:strand:+ start:87 stop:368 length:282 start_codon:yes stop_codon:yes gene_type:complete
MKKETRGCKPHHRKGSKTTRILKHLINGNTINSVKAFNNFNTTRLSSVIKCLRDMGYNIETFYKPNSKLGNYRMNSIDDGINVKLWEKLYNRG